MRRGARPQRAYTVSPVIFLLLLTPALVGCLGSDDALDANGAEGPASNVPTLPEGLEMDGAEVVSYGDREVVWRWEEVAGPGLGTPDTIAAGQPVETKFRVPAGLAFDIEARLSWVDDGATHLAVTLLDEAGKTRCTDVRSDPTMPPEALCTATGGPVDPAQPWTVRVDSYIAARQQVPFEVELTLGLVSLPDRDLPRITSARDVLWQAPSTASHPAYGFPTVNDPLHNTTAPVPAWWAPPEPAELPREIGGIRHAASVNDGEERGTSIALFGSLAVVPGQDEPATIWDVSDPTAPERLADLAGPGGKDADLIAYPDGRLVAVLATNARAIPVWDLTDPRDPSLLSLIETGVGVHNLEVVPGTPILYTADVDTGLPGQDTTEIYDLSDPDEPEHVQDWVTGDACHDITFHIDPARELYRGYCAAITVTEIWDVSDPRDPSVVTEVPAPHAIEGAPGTTALGTVGFSHLAMVNHDATLLIVGDETAANLAPTCDAYLEAGSRTASGPAGNLWIYDITDEQDAELVGWISPGTHFQENPPGDDRRQSVTRPSPSSLSCTAHFGQFVADTGLLAMSYAHGGVVLIDLVDPANPRIVDQWAKNTATWDVWFYQGYLITGDWDRGMDVFTLDRAGSKGTRS